MVITKNEVKVFFDRIRRLAAKAEILNQEIDRLETVASGGAITIDGQPRGNLARDMMSKAAAAAADVQRELDDIYSTILEVRWQVLTILAKLPEPEQMRVLQAKFMTSRTKTWNEIADETGYSVRQAQRYYSTGLDRAAEIIDQEHERGMDIYLGRIRD